MRMRDMIEYYRKVLHIRMSVYVIMCIREKRKKRICSIFQKSWENGFDEIFMKYIIYVIKSEESWMC